MNTLFEKAMDMEQPDFFKTYEEDGQTHHVARKTVVDWDYKGDMDDTNYLNPVALYDIRLDTGEIMEMDISAYAFKDVPKPWQVHFNISPGEYVTLLHNYPYQGLDFFIVFAGQNPLSVLLILILHIK